MTDRYYLTITRELLDDQDVRDLGLNPEFMIGLLKTSRIVYNTETDRFFSIYKDKTYLANHSCVFNDSTEFKEAVLQHKLNQVIGLINE